MPVILKMGNAADPANNDWMAPPKGALVVCAGTVSCTSVSGMGAGFNVFKRFFGTDNEAKQAVWATPLQKKLDGFHGNPAQAMPAYMGMTVQSPTNKHYTGGIATVPNLGANGKRLDGTQSTSTPGEKEKDDYKAAVQGAIRAAKINNQPLYIQPLGTGEYKWDKKLAGELFAEVINEEALASQQFKLPEVQIIIPGPDPIFSAALEAKLKFLNSPCTVTSEQSPQPLAPQPSPHTGAVNPGKGLQAIINDYTQNYKGTPKITEPDKDGSVEITFDSLADAKTFFSKNENLAHPFLMEQVGKSFAEGNHFYSCGDGQLYEGTPTVILNAMDKEAQKQPPGPNVQKTLEGIAILRAEINEEKAKKGTARYRGELVGGRELNSPSTTAENAAATATAENDARRIGAPGARPT